MCKAPKKVSIILPVYNGENHISDSVESILAQTYGNIELIAVDDCSTDRTQEILKEYADRDKRIKVIRNKENLRLPGTLNVGFSHATGDYLTWTSDDNRYREFAIEKLVEAIESHPNYDMVYSDYTNIDEEDRIISAAKLGCPDKLLITNCVGACFLYTRKIAEKVGGYDVNLFLAEDYDYWLRIYRYGKILHIEDDLYYYRRHSNSLTETRKDQIGRQTYKTLEKNFLFLLSRSRELKCEYAFWDHMLARVGHADASDIRYMINNISKGYAGYERRKKFKENLLNSGEAEMIRGIIKILRKKLDKHSSK